MNQYPKISIITASFNSAAYIEKAIESVRSQTYKNVEHIVMDGGSTDGTLEILKKYGDQVKWFSEKDTGIYNALNKGFKKATGDVVTWLDSDNFYFAPDVLEQVATAFAKDRKVQVTLADCYLEYPEQAGARERISPQNINFQNLLSRGSQFIPESIFYSRELFNRVGGLDEQYRLLADYDLWLKIFKTNPKLIRLPLVSAVFTVRDEALLRKNPWRSWHEGMAIGRSHGRALTARVRIRLLYYWERIKFPFSVFLKKRPALYETYKKYGRPIFKKIY